MNTSGNQATNVIPRDVIDAMNTLESHGYEAYIVGGSVRDILLGQRPDDYDITTNARPHEILKIFEEKGWKVVPKGIEYGVVSVIHPETKREIEIATYRKEIYTIPGKRRSLVSQFADTLKEDVERRDFTMNALAMNKEGKIIDHIGGLEDLKKGIIRAVGNPEDRFREDPLRMLRALRFASKLGYKIDENTMNAIKKKYKWIENVSKERIGEEIYKVAKAERKGAWPHFIQLLYKSNLYKASNILPELDDMEKTRHPNDETHYGETVLQHTLDVLNRLEEITHRLGEKPDPILRLAALFHDIGKPKTRRIDEHGRIRFTGHEKTGAEITKDILKNRWRLPNHITNPVTTLVRLHMYPHMLAQTKTPAEIASRLLTKTENPELVNRQLLLAMADTTMPEKYEQAIHEAENIMRKTKQPNPIIDGRMIMDIYGVGPGPEVGRIKKELYEVQLRYNLTKPEDIIKMACIEKLVCPPSMAKPMENKEMLFER